MSFFSKHVPKLKPIAIWSLNWVYQAECDMIITAYSNGAEMVGYVEAANPPTMPITWAAATEASNTGLCFLVAKGEYWKVEATNGTVFVRKIK